MKTKIGILCLVIAAAVSVFTALAHLSCIVLGPECYEVQLAPPQIIQSAIDRTWIAPVATLVISAIFLLCGAFALARAGIFRRIPLTKVAIPTIAAVCVIRGFLTLQLKFRHPELVDTFNLSIGIVWFITGLLFWFGNKFVGHQGIRQ